jgi:hypothetical protein
MGCSNDKINLSTSHENKQIRVIQLVFYGRNKLCFLFKDSSQLVYSEFRCVG